MKLSPDTLYRLNPRVATPTYDRKALARSIVHIGVGGFHRAHLAAYIDELAAAGCTDWAITGAGVLERDAAMAEALAAQDGLYTLVTRSQEGARARVIGSLVDYVLAVPDLDPLVDRIADPATRIVSLTVTEGGYPVDDDTSKFAPDSANAGADSAFAAIVRGLARRHDEGTGPVTVLSCDNVIGNGDVARTSTVGVAALIAPQLTDWIADEVAFPNSMVDRITPATTERDRAWLSEEFDIEDRWPVMTEPFRQWVVEDHFAQGRPPFEQLDIIITDDVEPYERFKLLLLNASHSSLAYLARLLDIELVDEVLRDQGFAGFIRGFLDEEAGPAVPPAPGIDLDEYKASLLNRLANPAIGDQVQRLCLDGSAKFPKFLLPTVRAQLDTGGSIRYAALGLAGWCAYLSGRTASGAPLVHAPDPRLAEAQDHAAASQEDPAAFLAFRAVFGDDLPANKRFVDAFVDALNRIRRHGVHAALDAATASHPGAIDG